MKARPGPESTTFSTSTSSSWARLPRMEKMTKPANNEVNVSAKLKSHLIKDEISQKKKLGKNELGLQ